MKGSSANPSRQTRKRTRAPRIIHAAHFAVAPWHSPTPAIFQAFTIDHEPGPVSTGETDAWPSPTIDPQEGAVYVATGDNYCDPPTDTSDAVLGLI